jgi:hypothetical protein
MQGEARAVAQAVSCRLPTAAARVQSRVSSCGICGLWFGRFSPSTSVSPAKYSTDYFPFNICDHPGLVQ